MFSRVSVDWRWPSNWTKQLNWLFTKEIIALTTSPTFLSRLTFYRRPTVIYVLLFLPSAVLFYQKTFIFLSSIIKPSLRKQFINNCGFHVFIELKIIPNYRSRCVSIRFLERFESYPIRLVSLSESERSNPSPLQKSCRKNLFQWKQKAYLIWKLEQSDNDPVWWKHTRFFTKNVFILWP